MKVYNFKYCLCTHLPVISW